MVSAPDLGHVLTGALRLDAGAFAHAARLRDAAIVALIIVLVAGLSEAIAQSAVLFANRVRPARFIFSLLVSALLFGFGFAFLVLSTWGVMNLLHHRATPFGTVALIFALSYAPLVFSIFGTLPSIGVSILWGLRIWSFCAMVVGISAVAGASLVQALAYVIVGWLVYGVAQQTVGKPISELGLRIADIVAGVHLGSEEDSAIKRVSTALLHPSKHAPPSAPPVRSRRLADRKTIAGVFVVAIAFAVVSYMLDPVRGLIFGWGTHAPLLLQLPLQLLWIALLGLIVAAFLAPLETLGWWAGWYGDQIGGSPAAEISATPADDVDAYVAYLDGISQSGSRYTGDIETFLDALAPRLPPRTRLVRGIMTYSVLNKPLEEDAIFTRFWALIDKLRFSNRAGMLGMFVNLRNVLIVAVSADSRYGPLYNFGVAQSLYDALLREGYRPGSGKPVTLIGYSGGAQMSCASAGFLNRALNAPIRVISLGGVMTGNCRFSILERMHHLVGTRDIMQRMGETIFPSRWKISWLSNWNIALRSGVVEWVGLGPVGHQVPGGMLDPNARLPDGRTNLDETLDDITGILRGLPVASFPAERQSGKMKPA